MRKLRFKVPRDEQQRTTRVFKGVRQVWYAGAWRSEEAAERHRAKGRERHRHYQQTNPEYSRKKASARRCNRVANKERERLYAAEYYRNNSERLNAKRVERARKNREQYRETWRDWRRRNREEQNAKEYTRRDARNPARIIRRLSKSLRNGELDVNEFVSQVKQQVDDHHARLRERLRPRKVRGRNSAPGTSQDRGGD